MAALSEKVENALRAEYSLAASELEPPRLNTFAFGVWAVTALSLSLYIRIGRKVEFRRKQAEKSEE